MKHPFSSHAKHLKPNRAGRLLAFFFIIAFIFVSVVVLAYKLDLLPEVDLGRVVNHGNWLGQLQGQLQGHSGPYDYNPDLEALEVGENFGAYTLIERVRSEDFLAEVFLFKHSATGSQVVYVAADDDNKWFSAVFKTPPTDDTGVNHILEHTVLEGSKRYTVKSPFTEMSKRSVNTYMNAMTGADVTWYPVASENHKDFDNLMRVYLDAVFAPLVVEQPLLLMQEGWRYEISNANVDENKTEYQYNGVVYNEMRGALEDRFDWIYTQIPRILYPDTHYRYNAGGDPEAIVDLTHDQLKTTHHNYYHPQNALLIFYGNLDLTEKLAYVDSQYYANYYQQNETRTNATMHQVQPQFPDDHQVKMPYPAQHGETPETDSMLSYSMALTDISQEDLVGLELLINLMTSTNSNSLADDVIDSGLGYELSGFVDSTYAQPMINFLVEGASKDGMAKFEQALTNQLDYMVANGIQTELIEGAINQYSLSFLERMNEANRGEYAIEALIEGFATSDKPLKALSKLESLRAIEEKSLEGNYFGDLIAKVFKNPSKTQISKVVFIPDSNLTKNKEAFLKEKLSTRIGAMHAKEQDKLKAEMEAYRAYQAHPLDKEALNALPTLKVTDLTFEPPEFLGDQQILSDTLVLRDEVRSNGIVSTKMYFSTEGLTKEEFTYLPVLEQMINIVDTDETRDQLDMRMSQLSSGIHTRLIQIQDAQDAKLARGFLTIGSTSLNEKVELKVETLSEVVSAGDYGDLEAVALALNLAIDEVDGFMSGEGDQVSLLFQRAGVTAAGARELFGVKEGYGLLLRDLERFEEVGEEVSEKVAALAKKVLVRNRLTVSVAADKAGLKAAMPAIERMLQKMPSGEKQTEGSAVSDWMPLPKQIDALTIEPMSMGSQLHYVEMGFHLSAIDHKLHGSDLVWMHMINEDYLYKKVRLEGGAYGGYTGISADNSVYFSAYRAPSADALIKAVKDLPTILSLRSYHQMEVDNAIVAVAGRLYQRGNVFEEVDSGVEQYLMPSKGESGNLLKEILATKETYSHTFAKWLQAGIDKTYGVDLGE